VDRGGDPDQGADVEAEPSACARAGASFEGSRAVTATARRGAERAKASRERGESAVREELARLDALQDELARAVA
jgi:hypothetical protein